MKDCKHLTGYWINAPHHFRCYECGCQIYIGNLSKREQNNPLREIEYWHGDSADDDEDEDEVETV